MGSAGWLELWKSALALAGRESVAVQIGIGLGAALVAAMFLEGVFASFRPRRYALLLARKYQPVAPAPPQVVVAAAPAASIALTTSDAQAAATRVSRNFAAPRSNRKRAVVSIRRQRPTRPKIQRMVNGNPSAAGKSPEN